MNAKTRSALSLLTMIVFSSLLCTAAFGQGGPPLIGDDPGTPGNGKWEINISAPYVQTDRSNSLDIPYIDANYGLGNNIELSYQGGFLLGKTTGESFHGGYDSSLLGVKWRFFDADSQGVDLSIYPQLGYNTTSAFARSGLAESGASFFFPVEIAKTFGKVELDAEAGYQYYQHDRDQWAAGPIIGYLLSDRIELLAECRFVADQDFRSNNLILDGGCRVNLAEHFQLLLAVGRGIRNGDDSPHLYVYTGLGITF
jgi:hypothetical protein